MSRKEVISFLSDDSSNHVNDVNVTDVNVDIPANAPIETIANIPVPNVPLTVWSDVTNNFVAENNITLSFAIRGAPKLYCINQVLEEVMGPP
jgi:hypothetical protein